MKSEHTDSKILAKLNTRHLPTLPGNVPWLLESLSNENIDFNRIVEVIECFPGIAGRLLSLANSVWSAPVSPVTTLEAACSRLGYGVVKSTSIALAIAAPFNPAKCPSFDAEYFWCSALMTAEAASRLATVSSSISDLDPSSARIAGLLHNLGLLWLVDRLPDELDTAFVSVKQNQKPSLQQALYPILEFDHTRAGAFLADSWRLPEALVAALAHYPAADYQGAHREIVNTVGLARELVRAVDHKQSWSSQDIRVANLGINEDDIAKVIKDLNLRLGRIRDLANILFVA